MIKVFCNCLEQKLGQKEQGNHHRLAKSAGRLDMKSRTVDSILFKKENDFCMTFGSACCRLTLRRLAHFA